MLDPTEIHVHEVKPPENWANESWHEHSMEMLARYYASGDFHRLHDGTWGCTTTEGQAGYALLMFPDGPRQAQLMREWCSNPNPWRPTDPAPHISIQVVSGNNVEVA